MIKSLTKGLDAPLVDAEFDPKSVANLVFWGEGDGPNILNGSTMSRLADQSGNANHADQAVAVNQPTFINSSPDFNNRPAIHFLGNDELRFSGTGLDMFRNTNGFTCFVVGKIDNFNALQFFLFASIATGLTTTRASMFPQTNQVLWGGVRRLDTDNGVAGSGGSVNTTDAFLFELFMDFDATTMELKKDGNTIYQNTTFGTAGNSSDTPSMGIAIGSSNGTNYLNGLVSAVIIYKRALNSAERDYIRKGLGEKYGIPVI